MVSVPSLAPRLQKLLQSDYPRYSDAEMARRRNSVCELLRDAGCDHLIYCGANRFGSAVQWLVRLAGYRGSGCRVHAGRTRCDFRSVREPRSIGLYLRGKGGRRLGRPIIDPCG